MKTGTFLISAVRDLRSRAEVRNIPVFAILTGLAALSFPGGRAFALGPADILPPEQAYPYTVTATGDAVEVSWDIEPGYYLYRERMSFASATPGIELGEPVMPAGEIHEDEFFGRMEIYRGPTAIRIPFSARDGAPDSLSLEIRSQGCADLGVCYPPQNWIADVRLPSSPARAAGGLFDRPRSTSGALSNPVAGEAAGPLGDLAGNALAESGFLPPEEAFRFVVDAAGPNLLTVQWQIAEGYYLYRDKFAFEAENAAIQLGNPELPPGEPKHDEYFGDTEVYYDTVTANIPFARASPEAAEVTLLASYQGCAEDGICYPPISGARTVQLAALDPGDIAAATALIGDSPGGTVSEQDRLAGIIGQANLLVMLGVFFVTGLGLAFTPCVLPMIPILSGIIAGQGNSVTPARAFGLSVTYVLGMALTYTVAGALFAAAGQQVQAVFQQPWIIATFSALFVLLALSMFGFYELQMPAAIQSRIAALSNRQKGGTWIGAAIMGALSALIVTACVVPALVAALAVIGQSGDVARGASALFALSLGMGAPLIVFGTSAGKLLPKAGPWMDTVKAAFGVLMLGLAIWIASRILPGPVTLLLWAGLVFVAGVFFGAVEPLPPGAGGGRKLIKGLGLAALVYGAVLLVGAASGGADPLRPLASLGTTQAAKEGLEFKRVKTVADFERELAAAGAAGETVMLDFYADWCVSCKEMEKYTFTDDRVQRALAGTRLLQADVTANDEADQALLHRFGIYGPPTIAFFGRDGRERVNYRLIGFMDADDFHEHVQGAVASPLVSAAP
ncbi:MAG: protein-disulfide reductase DsbD [Gammaproteobacteria bacterium]